MAGASTVGPLVADIPISLQDPISLLHATEGPAAAAAAMPAATAPAPAAPVLKAAPKRPAFATKAVQPKPAAQQPARPSDRGIDSLLARPKDMSKQRELANVEEALCY